jgi:hypothetical protein
MFVFFYIKKVLYLCILIETHMKEFEIGERVTWKIGTFVCFGAFLEKINDEFSKVQCRERKEESAAWSRRYICEVKVLNSLLESAPETE